MHYITQLTEAVNIPCNLFLFYNKWQPKVSLPTAVRRYVIVKEKNGPRPLSFSYVFCNCGTARNVSTGI